MNIFSSIFLLLLLFLLFLLWNEISVIFSDFLLSNEMSGYTENISTIIFFMHILLLSYEPVKVYRIDLDHPVLSTEINYMKYLLKPKTFLNYPHYVDQMTWNNTMVFVVIAELHIFYCIKRVADVDILNNKRPFVR